MFFQYQNQLTELELAACDPNRLTVGYVTSEELAGVSHHFGFAKSTVAACGKANTYFRSGVEIYDDYTFTELRVIGAEPENDDWIALYVKRNLLLVVDVLDTDGSTKAKFTAALARYNPDTVTKERLIFAFLDQLVAGDLKELEDLGIRLSDLEEQLLEKDVDSSFNYDLLAIKKRLQRLHNYYEQILDITEALDEDENELFQADKLIYISNFTRRLERLREDADSLKNTVEHLQDAYFSFLDARLNHTMKILTVVTTIFFPLTIIVGWYGMNFTNMPELTWRFGYLYVIILSIVVVLALAIFGKFRKWFR